MANIPLENYHKVVDEIIKMFSKKQGIEFTGWVGDNYAGIATFIDEYFFNMQDIILDLTTKQKKGFILNWSNEGVEHNMFNQNPLFINYESYIKGLRYTDLKKGKIKPIPEAAQEYAHRLADDKLSGHNKEHRLTTLDIIKAFRAGADYGNQWIDVKDDLPDVGVVVLVKAHAPDMKFVHFYYTSRILFDKETKIWADAGFVVITHWRYI